MQNFRWTRQTIKVFETAKVMGHASNIQLHQAVSEVLPGISATTVHRITRRLVSRRMLAEGPEIDGSKIIDSNTLQHDHFVCNGCEGIKDINVSDKIRLELQKQIGINVMDCRLIISGDCSRCDSQDSKN